MMEKRGPRVDSTYSNSTIKTKGLHIPVIPEIYEPVLQELELIFDGYTKTEMPRPRPYLKILVGQNLRVSSNAVTINVTEYNKCIQIVNGN